MSEPIDDDNPPVKILRGNKKITEYIREDIVHNRIMEAKRSHYNQGYADCKKTMLKAIERAK
tara:strand:+ start:9528 stop:9713 length:186 start_codon:yes stop_codon:yes gene_type:complete